MVDSDGFVWPQIHSPRMGLCDPHRFVWPRHVFVTLDRSVWYRIGMCDPDRFVWPWENYELIHRDLMWWVSKYDARCRMYSPLRGGVDDLQHMAYIHMGVHVDSRCLRCLHMLDSIRIHSLNIGCLTSGEWKIHSHGFTCGDIHSQGCTYESEWFRYGLHWDPRF